MALVPTLKTWLLVVPALALLGVVGYRAGDRVLHAEHVASQGDEPAAASAPSAVPAEARQLARRLLGSERGTAVASGLPLDLRADIEGDTDLFAYAQRLQLQAHCRLADKKRFRSTRNRAQAHRLQERPQRLEPIRLVGKTRSYGRLGWHVETSISTTYR